ncbi:hypothetical protein BaRGS_00036801 [Batillaria attramentaria]|uniref:Uncharacterized protein n=1 Tax=Batillaria attramentaria TaxID=370345 RepID=A0ABD0JBT0_9CAEN
MLCTAAACAHVSYHPTSGLMHQRVWAFASHLCTAAAYVHFFHAILGPCWVLHHPTSGLLHQKPPAYTFLPVSSHIRPFAPEGLDIFISHPCTAAACIHLSAHTIPYQVLCIRGPWHFASHTCCVLQPPAYTFLPVSSHIRPFAPEGLGICISHLCVQQTPALYTFLLTPYHLRSYAPEDLGILHLTPVYCSRLRTLFCLYPHTSGLLHQRVWAFASHTCVLQPPAYTFLLRPDRLRSYAPEDLGILRLTPAVYCSRMRTHFSYTILGLCCVLQPPAYTYLPVSSHTSGLLHQRVWAFASHMCTAAACEHLSAHTIPSQVVCTRGPGHFASHTCCVLQPPAYTFLLTPYRLRSYAPEDLGILHLTPARRLRTHFCLYPHTSGLSHQRVWAFASHTCVYSRRLRTPFCSHHTISGLMHQRTWAFCISHLCTAAACVHFSACILTHQAFCTRGSGHLGLTPVYCSRLHTPFCSDQTVSGLMHQRTWAFCVSHLPCTAAACVHIFLIPS